MGYHERNNIPKDSISKSVALKKKMKEGIHRVGSNPSRFVHRDPKAGFDLYEKWHEGKQTFKKTK